MTKPVQIDFLRGDLLLKVAEVGDVVPELTRVGHLRGQADRQFVEGVLGLFQRGVQLQLLELAALQFLLQLLKLVEVNLGEEVGGRPRGRASFATRKAVSPSTRNCGTQQVFSRITQLYLAFFSVPNP